MKGLFAASMIFAVCAVAAAQEPTVPPILRRALEQVRHQRYVGRRTVQFLKGPHSGSHEEIVYRDGDRTRIEFPEGSPLSGQIIVEDARERHHFFPDKNEIRILPPRREEALRHLAHLGKPGHHEHFVVSEGAGESVAGQPTDQIVVTDLSGNVAQRLFIDRKSGVVLKRQLFDAVGSQVGYFEFTQVDLNPRPFDSSIFRIERKGARIVTPYDEFDRLAASRSFDRVVLPKSSGFVLEEARISRIDGQPILVSVYGSRQGKLSLFQVSTPVDPNRLQRMTHGNFHLKTWTAGAHSFVMISGLSDAQMDRLAQTASSGTP